MKVLMVNKFLYPNGGSETYIFKLGDYLKSIGHQVEYFGMEHERNVVGNSVGAYTSNMDFHNSSGLSKITYAFKTIYSHEARKKIRLVLEKFQPDVVHLNNFNYQLTPSIILEIRKWEKTCGKKCKIVYTAHDSQLVCPNHLMQNPINGKVCTECLEKGSYCCAKNKCIHGSSAKSIIGTLEAYFWKIAKVYRKIDVVISPSEFLRSKLSYNDDLKDKIKVVRNFVESISIPHPISKKDYVLYFGRYSKEKGIETLLEVCKQLPHIQFVFAGSGPLEESVNNVGNIINKGFLSGEELYKTISEARFTVFPSECYENCPFTVMESIMCGTPVLGANIGGIPELIEPGVTGELFDSGDVNQIKEKIISMLDSSSFFSCYSRKKEFNGLLKYCDDLYGEN